MGKNHQRMQSLVDQMQSKIKSYKKQIEEAEEIAALNLAKYRQVQSALGVAEERADMSNRLWLESEQEQEAHLLDLCKRLIKPEHNGLNGKRNWMTEKLISHRYILKC